jgi:signal transduction histidine kinase
MDEDLRFTEFWKSSEQRSDLPFEFSVKGMHLWDLPTANVSAADWESIKAKMRAGEEITDFRVQWETRDGKPCWFSLGATPIPNESTHEPNYLGIAKDITAFVEQAERSRDNAIRLSSLQSEFDRVSLARVMSHEIKGPIDLIGALLKRMKAHVAMTLISEDSNIEKMRIALVNVGAGIVQILESFDLAQKNFRLCMALTNQDLAVRPMEVAEFLKMVAEEQGPGVRATGARFEVLVHRGGQVLIEDETMRVVFQSLIRNSIEAFDATHPRDPYISITLKGCLHVDDQSGKSFFRIEVEDNAGGMPQGIADNILGEIPVSSPKRGRYALGLSSCLDIVRQQGGKIQLLRNGPTKTVFEILLLAEGD